MSCPTHQPMADRPGQAPCKRRRAQSRAAGARPMARSRACVCSGSSRRAIAKRPSLVGRSPPVLRDEEWHRATACPVAGALGGHLPDHLLDSVFGRPSGASSIARTTRTPNKCGTAVIGASRSRGLPPQFSRRSPHRRSSGVRGDMRKKKSAAVAKSAKLVRHATSPHPTPYEFEIRY